MDALKVIEEGMLKEQKPEIRIGDVVKVSVKIREGERERIQMFSYCTQRQRGFRDIYSSPCFLRRWR